MKMMSKLVTIMPYGANPMLMLDLPETLMTQLQAAADKQQTPINTLIQAAIEAYLMDAEDDDDMEDTPKEQILADLREALEDVKAGRLIPAEEGLALLRKNLGYANES
jgi:cell division protein FtsX